MRKSKTHYYSNRYEMINWDTACGRDGHKTGGLIAFFFKIEKKVNCCKTCYKIFEKEQNEKTIQKTE